MNKLSNLHHECIEIGYVRGEDVCCITYSSFGGTRESTRQRSETFDRVSDLLYFQHLPTLPTPSTFPLSPIKALTLLITLLAFSIDHE